jgi:glutathione S-transferase
MKIHGDLGSGNCLKVKYTADVLGLPYTWVPVDIMKGEAQTAAFRCMNPAGQTPVLETADGKYLAQSNAIIRYLARGSSLLPDDAWTQAKIDEWLFWEQYSHEPYIAVCRFHMVYKKLPKDTRDPMRVERAEKALDLMDEHLLRMSQGDKATPSIQPYLVGWTLTIADIALLAYTRVAHEGGFDLSPRPNVQAWIKRCEAALKRPQKGSGS